jgi:4-aminobutyrate aminotransferase / (S)-3-amino-2-methylpropionate transaminase / 5-aminovalerate transaminase
VDPDRLTGDELPEVRTAAVPGPRSRALSARLRTVESRNITCVSDASPIFWADARGAAVRDVDGNVFVDLTAGFGVAMAGHSPPAVAAAIAAQAARLAHALGDVHPADIKVALLEALAGVAPGDLGVAILGSAGAEAVEAALKTALLRTGRPGVLAFENAYHGMTYGALSTTWRALFREPFQAQLFAGVRFAPFPSDGPDSPAREAAALATVHAILDKAETGESPIGAILIEPIQGRGGINVPTPGFLPALRDLCDGRTRLLIADEIYTGFGRTGRWFACEHWNVVPDLLVVGKALGGGLPLSAAIGTPAVMDAWPPSRGEAIHTSTFLGNPVACAAALAQIREIEAGRLVPRAELLGTRIRSRVEGWVGRIPGVEGARGMGVLQAVVLNPRRAADRTLALDAADAALRRGVLVLAEGEDADVLAITPPAVITDAQLDAALDALEDSLRQAAAA